jgi:hypothetical protein
VNATIALTHEAADSKRKIKIHLTDAAGMS